jgi:hypothetical protein
MKKLGFLITFSMVLLFQIRAQFIENRMDLYIGLQGNSMKGDEMVREGDFTAPALFPNMETGRGLVFKGVFNLGNIFSIGAGLRQNKYTDWTLTGYDVYQTALVKTSSLSVILGLHTPFKESGLMNRLRFSIQLAPVIGVCKFSSEATPYIIISGTDNLVNGARESKDFLWGAELSGGLDFTVSNDVGLYVRFGYQQNQVSSKLYLDDRFSSCYYEGGAIFRLSKNKRFYF